MSRPSALTALAAAALPLLAVLSPTAQAAPAPTAPVAVPVPPPPPLNATSYILVDYNTGKVLAAKNPNEKLAMASLTKLLAVYITLSALKSGQLSLNTPVLISTAAWRTGGSRMFVNPGTKVTVLNLLKGIIVDSGNDATVALAQKIGGTRAGFVSLMNDYARRLGLHSTHYEDVDGLPVPDHYTTARDLSELAIDLLRDFPRYRFIFKIKKFTWDHITQRNRVSLLWTDPSVDGLKTGHTEAAGYCLIASADRKAMRLISVVLHAPSWDARLSDSEALLNYGFNNFETEKVVTAGAPVLKPRVYESAAGYAAVGAARNLYITVPRSRAASLQTNAALTQTQLVAPLAAGSVVGQLTVTDGNGQVVGREPLVTLEAVPAGGLLTRAVDGVRLWFK